MSDTQIAPQPAAPSIQGQLVNLPVAPGVESSEHARTKRLQGAAEIVGLVGALAATIGGATANPILAAVGGALVAIAGYVGRGAVVGYLEARTELKAAALETAKAVEAVKAGVKK
jgi:hypothetical protein